MSISTEGTKLRFGGHELPCLLGDFEVKQTRDVKEKRCTLSGSVRKSLGASKVDNITFLIPKGEAVNAAAEAAIRTAYANKELLSFEVEDNDMPSGGTNGSKIAFNCYVFEDVVSYKEDDDLEFSFSITIDGDITKTAAA